MIQTHEDRWIGGAGRIGRTALAGLILAAAAGGCIRKFNRANYETISMQMDPHVVRSKLGRPDLDKGNVWIYRREKPYYQAIIYFRNDMVVRKEWYPSRDLAPGDEQVETEFTEQAEGSFVRAPTEPTTAPQTEAPDQPDDSLAPTPLSRLPRQPERD